MKRRVTKAEYRPSGNYLFTTYFETEWFYEGWTLRKVRVGAYFTIIIHPAHWVEIVAVLTGQKPTYTWMDETKSTYTILPMEDNEVGFKRNGCDEFVVASQWEMISHFLLDPHTP